MPCMTGSGANLTATGLSGNGDTIIAGLDIQSMGPWTTGAEELEAPQLKAPVGTLMPYCLGGIGTHDTFDVVCYHRPEIDLNVLVMNIGTYTRTHADGSAWSGVGSVVSAQPMPNEGVNELSMTTLQIRFTQGVVDHTPTGP